MNWLTTLESALRSAVRPSPRQLRDLLNQLDLSPSLLREFVVEPSVGVAYGRNSLLRFPEAEVVVVHLPPGAATWIHDHGLSVGCARLVEGSLINRLYRLDEAGFPALQGEVPIRTGANFTAPAGQIHQLANLGDTRAVSLHVYAPLQRDSRVYLPYEQALDYVI